MSKIDISMQTIFKFSKKYHEQFFIVGSVMNSRIQKILRMSQGIIFKHLPYIYFVRNYEKSITFGSVMKFRKRFRISKFITFIQPPYINFLKYYEKSVIVESVLMSRIQTTFQNVEVYYFMQPPCINFIRYYDKLTTVGSAMMSGIQNTFQNLEVYYFYAAAIY